MDHFLTMRRSHPRTDPAHQPQGALSWKTFFAMQELAKRCPSNKLHYNKGWGIAITCLAVVMNSNDVWVMQHRGGARLSAKPRKGGFVLRELLQQNFHSHYIPDVNTTRTVDDAHAALSSSC